LAGELYTTYGRRRRRRWPYLAGAAACVLAALVAWQVVAVPGVSAVTPGPDAFVNRPSLSVVLNIKGMKGLEDLRVALDGADVTETAEISAGSVTFQVSDLSDGLHVVSFDASSSNLIRREVHESWRFTVDTSLPTLELEGSMEDGRVNTSPAIFTGVTEPFATVTAKSGAISASGTAAADGSYRVSAPLPDGPSTVVISTIDRAGNAVAKTLDVYVDAVPPTLSVSRVPATLERTKLNVRVSATDQLGPPKVVVELDGVKQRMKKTEAAVLSLAAKGLAQGTHHLAVTVSDNGGNVVTDEQEFLVDSTERFGSEAMWAGARGNDVKSLQKRLATLGVFEGKRGTTYDKRTVAAVKEYQSRVGLQADGRVDGDTLTALGGQIIVDLGELRLYLYHGSKVYKSYRIATGQAAYPTPMGSFTVVNKQVDPTWVPPPDAAWAKGAKPIPPGPGNPLGTRWIGLSYPGVGIHGTSDDSSIGTYASHGCIRMHTWEVEQLFSMVVVGMPVTIRP
jgi:lipoprotein-anchoring transpeptidase ErfK/SrfK